MLFTLSGKAVILLFISSYITVTLQNEIKENQETENIQRLLRAKRAVQKPGFFRTLFSVAFEQFKDTRDTFSKVNKMINDNFLPENAPLIETTTSNDPNATTTEAPYKITRSELNRILQRNLKGLIRLYNIELQQALDQSKKNRREYDEMKSKEISKFL